MRPATAASVPSILTTPASIAKPSPPPRATACAVTNTVSRRDLLAGVVGAAVVVGVGPAARAASDEEYVKDTAEMIGKVRSTISMDRADPNVADAVGQLRELSNEWVAKYRREKALLGRPSFRDMYSALNAVSGHYISFGPTAPIPAKRKARILEEMDTAEKALLRGR